MRVHCLGVIPASCGGIAMITLLQLKHLFLSVNTCIRSSSCMENILLDQSYIKGSTEYQDWLHNQTELVPIILPYLCFGTQWLHSADGNDILLVVSDCTTYITIDNKKLCMLPGSHVCQGLVLYNWALDSECNSANQSSDVPLYYIGHMFFHPFNLLKKVLKVILLKTGGLSWKCTIPVVLSFTAD